jgi:hypothetical protein
MRTDLTWRSALLAMGLGLAVWAALAWGVLRLVRG